MTPSWLDPNEYPFDSQYLSLDGVRLHYIDEGRGDVVLFVHGTPSWSFDFRHIIKSLSKFYRCIAIDHIGFGLSDKPANYDYATPKHSENLRQLIDKLELNDITLVVHDFGGPIGLNYAIHHPERIKQHIIFNTWLWSSEKEEEYIRFQKILKNPLLPFLYKYLNFSAGFILPQSFADKAILTNKLRKHYIKPFRNPSERLGTIGFSKSLLNDQGWFEELWSKRASISEKRTLFIWGMADKFILPKYLEKFEREFTDRISVKFQDCGHYPQEEKKELVVSEIQSWLQGLGCVN